jgi:hypothetical protein
MQTNAGSEPLVAAQREAPRSPFEALPRMLAGLAAAAPSVAAPVTKPPAPRVGVKLEHPKPPYDLTDRMGNFYAYLKTINTFDGTTVFVPQFGRVMLMPPGKPASVLFNQIGIYLFHMSRPPSELVKDQSEHTYLLTSKYTGFVVDPVTLEPLETIASPITGETLEVSQSVFGDSFIIDPRGNYSALRPDYFYEKKPAGFVGKPYALLSGDVSFLVEGIFHDEGPHQPRGTSLIWRAKLADVMNPGVTKVAAAYDYQSLAFGWERAWMRFPRGDQTQLFWHVTGKKVFALDDVPPLVRNLVAERYPERLSI